MRTIGNIPLVLYLEDYWAVWPGFAGCIWCITIIGIPVGLQCFRICNLGILAVWKRNRVWKWHVFISGKSYMDYIFGWEMALGNLIVGCIWCITIVGIPFGKKFFKMARLSSCHLVRV